MHVLMHFIAFFIVLSLFSSVLWTFELSYLPSLTMLKVLFQFYQLTKDKDLDKSIESCLFKIWRDQTRLHGVHPSEV